MTWFNGDLEISSLVDQRGRSVWLREVLDYPTLVAFTPDHRLVWVSDKHGNHGIYRSADGSLVAIHHVENDGSVVPRITTSGTLGRTRDGTEWGTRQAPAIVRTARHRWLTFGGGVLAENGHGVAVVDGTSQVAAFDPDGTRLAYADRRAVVVIDVDSLARVAQWPIGPLADAATAS